MRRLPSSRILPLALATLAVTGCQMATPALPWPPSAGLFAPSHRSGRLGRDPIRRESFLYRASCLGLTVGAGSYTVEHLSEGRLLVTATVSTTPLADLIAPFHATMESRLTPAPSDPSARQRAHVVPQQFVWNQTGADTTRLPVVTIDPSEHLATRQTVTESGSRVEFLAIDDPLDILSLIENLRQGLFPGDACLDREVLTPRGKLWVRTRDLGTEDVQVGDQVHHGCRHVLIESRARSDSAPVGSSATRFRYSLWITPAPRPTVIRATRHGLLADTVVDLVAIDRSDAETGVPVRQPLALNSGQTTEAVHGR